MQIWNFIKEHISISIFIVIALYVIVTAIIKHTIYEYIDCKIIDKKGMIRHGHARRRRRDNYYEVYTRDRQWIQLEEKNIHLLESKRHEMDKHGRPIIPEIHVH